ncbi:MULTISPECIES: phosphoglucomutase/phosphomannomutase PgmG [unclassified Novosphingobium]|uniref:phosphoglucomutase/phosphomannomutase PgmG n=1 Tax=unclassified Novosphingobium TaxID=2644732 RepID=UPI0014941BBD|nr:MULTISPECIES: phosphomannomutase/phosphoglucomutase [unclassified Novosphingobium]MBB3360062.1 phosphomannomutase [Novosphingobium sp. BK256]MBB3376449.1 phosphomannomutase [Novosphingobium sp. BK280]MBB3380835.1 phosphomannomutase [Novosphingobium sp. BK258]MBB3422513.1 phosphomannomutase [Novosphingobium sp. BK267]MBB3451186.1 phosphomannomutase [Novosphingobium sp. BK352]
MNHSFDPTILREYDVRGVFGESLGADDARAIGRCFGTQVVRAGGGAVVVGMDGRVSSPILEHALVEGLSASGADVVRIGLGPTPMLYFAALTLPGVAAGIQITGSHNPAHHNGFKLVRDGQPFFGEAIQDLGRQAQAGDWDSGTGTVRSVTVLDAYVDRLLKGLDGIDRASLAGLSMAWDAGNGAAGPVLERLVARLPGQHRLLFTEVDGTFPHHHPDPTVEENLADLRQIVVRDGCDFGVAFDGDADRIGAVDGLGRLIWADQIVMILAQDLLARRPGALVLGDIKTGRALFDRVRALGGQAQMWKSGHSHMKTRLRESGALLAGEMSGHVFLADDWYGFDDGIYAAIRLIAAAARLGQSINDLRGAMPDTIATPELRFAVDEARKFTAVDEVKARLEAQGADMVAIDGVRVTTPDGWWLLRASHTQAVLVARAESESEAGLARLMQQIDTQLALSGLARTEQVPH